LVSPQGFREFEISNTDNLVFFRGVNQSFPTGVSVNDGEWHHLAVAIRIDAESWKINLFVDTILVAQRTLPTYREIAAGERHRTNLQQARCLLSLLFVHSLQARALSWVSAPAAYLRSLIRT
jgi:hypothetical protein